MTIEALSPAHRIFVFEGVDGVGKSTLAAALANYLVTQFPQVPVAQLAFPGAVPGTLGSWVYRLHHGEFADLRPESIHPAALQLMHVAAHIDGIHSWIEPALSNGEVILDRYWWSTYAYSRRYMIPEVAFALVGPELPFWQTLPRPTVFYVSRSTSLKSGEVSPDSHLLLDGYYREVIEREKRAGVDVYEIVNDGPLDDCWCSLLDCLVLPYAPLSEDIA